MNMRSRRAAALTAAAVLASAGLAACGDDEDSTSSSAATATSSEDTASTTSAAAAGGGGATVTFEADPNGDLAFTETEVSAQAGESTIEFDNPSSTPHNVEIESADGEEVAGTDTITAGKTSTTADLQPGTYTFFCEVPGHREAGMEGTLTVK